MSGARYRSRKFILSLVSLIAGIVALLIGKMTDSTFVMLVGVVLSGYGIANVAEKMKRVDSDVGQGGQ